MQGDLSFQILTYCSALLEVCNYGMPLHYQEMQHRNKTNEEQKWAKLEDLHETLNILPETLKDAVDRKGREHTTMNPAYIKL